MKGVLLKASKRFITLTTGRRLLAKKGSCSVNPRMIASLATTSALGLMHSAAFAQPPAPDMSPTSSSSAAATNAPTTIAPPAGTSDTSTPATTAAANVRPRGRTAPSGDTGDIVVTARRTEERLQDVPISITVFNQQQLSNRNIVQAQDLSTYTPSLSTNSFFGSTNTIFSLRGFNQQFGTYPTVGTYFADVVSPRGAVNNGAAGDGASPGSFFDLQNIQVLKGPQGTLFGLNTTGGAVLLVPQKPTSKFEGYVEGSYGNYDLKRIQGVVNVPFSDRARFRLGVDHESRDGYLKNNGPRGPRRFDDLNYTAVRASLVLDLTPDIENYTIMSYIRSVTNGDLQALYTVNPDASNVLGSANFMPFAQLAAAQQQRYGSGFYTTGNWIDDPQTKYDQWQIINTTTWHATDNLTVKNITSYAQLKESVASSLFGTFLDLYDFGLAFAPGTPTIYPYRGSYTSPNQAVVGLALLKSAPGAHTANQSSFTEELQLQGRALDGKLQYQGGVYIQISDPLGLQGSISENTLFCESLLSTNCANPLQQGSVSLTSGRTRFRDYAVYSQATYSLTDQIKVTGGVRYTWDDQTINGQQFAYQYPLRFTLGPPLITPASPNGFICANPEQSLPSCSYHIHEKSHKPTWLIDLEYKPDEDILVYAKYSRGYRSGGISGGVPTQYETYRPEKLDAYEIGTKTSFRGAVKGSLNVAAFYNDFRNEQTQASFFPKVTGTQQQESGTINADKSRSYGVEVEGTVSPFRGLTIDAGYAYINAKIKKIPQIALPDSSPFFALSSARNGDNEQFVPRNKYTINTTYVLPLSTDVGRISVGATFSHSDKQVAQYAARDADGSLSPFSIIEKRNLLDLNANWNSIAGTPIDLQAFATNVTNKKYYTGKTGLYTAVGFDLATIGPPRMYGGRIRFHF